MEFAQVLKVFQTKTLETIRKPLIGWILEKAKDSKYINKLVVSTDSEKYAKIAKKFDAEVPCLRPKKLAENFSPEIDFVKTC